MVQTMELPERDAVSHASDSLVPLRLHPEQSQRGSGSTVELRNGNGGVTPRIVGHAPIATAVQTFEHEDRRPLDGLAERLRALSGHVAELVRTRRDVDTRADDPYRGLYVSDEQALALSNGQCERFEQPVKPAFSERISIDGSQSSDRFDRFATAFGLDALDLDLLTIIVAPDLEPRFEKLYGYLHDDITQRRATLSLCLELTGRGTHDREIRDRLGPNGPLIRQGIVHVEDPGRPVLTRALRVDDQCCVHLLGMIPSFALDRMIVRVGVIEDAFVSRLAEMFRRGLTSAFLRDVSSGVGIAIAASAFVHAGLNPLCVDLRDEDVNETAVDALRLLQRAKYASAALVVAIDDDVHVQSPGFVRTLVSSRWPCLIIGASPWNALWSTDPVVSFDVERLPATITDELWTRLLPSLSREELAPVTQQLRLRPEQVLRSADLAQHLSESEGRAVVADDVAWAARAQNSARLERLAKRTAPAVTWTDLVLPTEVRASLMEIESRYRYRDVVYGTWNVAGKNNRRLGVIGLFAGSSGVGKTMAAEALAGALGLDMYQVNLSSVVDKYIGETEKNLERIFSAAEGVNGVLLFDEADALFGKRSEVSDAKDRYANVEVAYLLQRLESYEGIAILATNLRTNIDDAFTRRLDVLVDFPEPDETHRLLLWQRFLEKGTPMAPDVDLEFLAAKFRLSGGNIRNVCVTGAFLAAARGDSLSMADLVRSTAQEYRKLGRLCTPSEFGPWSSVLSSSSN
jgi:SpoVK/Ycf46/Vps4 family AAA+-type ATPase